MNWRAFLAWFMGVWPSFRKHDSSTFGTSLLTCITAGFIVATGGAKLDNPAYLRLFQTAWFIGFLGSALIYYLVCLISPPPGHPYKIELFGNEHEGVIEGKSPSGANTPTDVEKASIALSLKGRHN
jgi:NCS1 family nucleobase:cation symporter-1